MRLIALALGASMVAACGSATTSYAPNAVSPGSGAATALRAAKAPVPSFLVSTILPDATRPHTVYATVGSLRATTYVKAKKYVDVVNNGTCSMGDNNGTAEGCGVYSNTDYVFDITKSTFEFYSKAGGKGCLLASAKFKGQLGQGPMSGLVFKAFSTKTCWKS